jgi:YgiT-type zinc finger domain-containing protein
MSNNCRICGSDNTEIITGTEIFEYKGHKVSVPEYTKLVCHNCNEAVADQESVEKSLPILRDAQREIDGADCLKVNECANRYGKIENKEKKTE